MNREILSGQSKQANVGGAPLGERAWQLLGLLADGEFHTGTALAQALGLSRPSVGKLAARMEAQGVVLQRIQGRGYRLAQPWVPLRTEAVLAVLGDLRDEFSLEIRREATSTNALLLQQAAQQARSGIVLVAEWQTAGRGRLGRPWMSGLGNALTFSLLWRFDVGLNALAGLSLAVGVAIVRALNALGASSVGLKWPNDVLTPQGKLAGVLIEAQGDMLGPSAVVIGIGLNVRPPALEAMLRIDQPVSALSQVCAALPEREIVLARLLQELSGTLRAFSLEGLASLRAEWQKYHVHQDQPVRVKMPDGRLLEGIARGINPGGELRLETAGGILALNSGELGACS